MSEEPLIQSLPRTEREVVFVKVPPHRYEMTIAIEDGRRISVTYGNTTWYLDAETGRWLGSSTSDLKNPPSVKPSLTVGRIGPDKLAEINDATHRLVYGDGAPP